MPLFKEMHVLRVVLLSKDEGCVFGNAQRKIGPCGDNKLNQDFQKWQQRKVIVTTATKKKRIGGKGRKEENEGEENVWLAASCTSFVRMHVFHIEKLKSQIRCPPEKDGSNNVLAITTSRQASERHTHNNPPLDTLLAAAQRRLLWSYDSDRADLHAHTDTHNTLYRGWS